MRSLIGRTTTGEVVAGVAQLVEQRIRNAKVGGSIPLTGTIKSSISALLQTFPSFFWVPIWVLKKCPCRAFLFRN